MICEPQLTASRPLGSDDGYSDDKIKEYLAEMHALVVSVDVLNRVHNWPTTMQNIAGLSELSSIDMFIMDSLHLASEIVDKNINGSTKANTIAPYQGLSSNNISFDENNDRLGLTFNIDNHFGKRNDTQSITCGGFENGKLEWTCNYMESYQ